MSVTDLLSRIPFPPPRRAAARPAAGAGDESAALTAWDAFSAPAEFRPPVRAARVPLPSWVVLALGSAALSAVGLLALFTLRPLDVRSESAAIALAPDAPRAAATTASPEPAPAATAPAAETTFGADPTPVPAEAIARLEAAANEPLHGELTGLLDAIQVGFGAESAGLDPALRPYTVRMASRFEWNPDTFHVAVAAPTAALAEARVATLRRVFSDAVAAHRLQIEPTVGPGALTLASP